MKKIVLFFVLCIVLASCGSNHYSPLDNYVKAINERAANEAKHQKGVKHFLDSLNIK